MARRFDRGEFRTPVVTEAGFLRADAYVTRAGVFDYRDSQGKIKRELRHPTEVFAPESLASLSMVPLTLEHPEAGCVTADTARALTVGHIGDTVEQDGALVRSPVLVTDGAAVKAVIEGTHRETSCGYTADVDETPGVYNGEPYDAAQKNIRYNHVALVAKGRAGPDVRVRLDSDSMAQVENSPTAQPAHGAPMLKKVKRNDVTIELEEKDAQVLEMVLAQIDAQISSTTQQMDGLKQKLADAMKSGAEAQAASTEKDNKIAATEAKADALTADLTKTKAALAAATDPKATRDRVTARVSLERQASRILGAATKLDALDDLEIKKQVIVKVSPETKLDGKIDAYIDARFDAAVESAAKDNPALLELRVDANEIHADSGDDISKAHAAMIERNRKLSTEPLKN